MLERRQGSRTYFVNDTLHALVGDDVGLDGSDPLLAVANML